MKDCIKTEEIKMFLGTDLKVNVNEPYASPKIKWFIHSVDIKGNCAMFDNSRRVDCVPLEDITPLVKPLSSLTDEELISMFLIANQYDREHKHYKIERKGRFTKIIYTGDYRGDYAVIELYTELNNIIFHTLSSSICVIAMYNQLAEHYVDIFNWIGRGLANEIK